jgi:hypothetical protein
MSAKVLGSAGLLAVAVFVAAFLLKVPEPAAPPTVAVAASTTAAGALPAPAAGPVSSQAADPAPASQGYTMAQVAAHGSASSCWSAINGKVYDLTRWIGRHPGGSAAILSLCGRDGSAAFNDQHGGQGRPASELASFYLAPLL